MRPLPLPAWVWFLVHHAQECFMGAVWNCHIVFFRGTKSFPIAQDKKISRAGKSWPKAEMRQKHKRGKVSAHMWMCVLDTTWELYESAPSKLPIFSVQKWKLPYPYKVVLTWSPNSIATPASLFSSRKASKFCCVWRSQLTSIVVRERHTS